jgi:HK97 family phage portal protein
MSLVRRLQAASSPIGPNPFQSVNRYPFWSSATQAGKTVTVERALRFDAVWACIRLRSSATWQTPIRIFERLDEDDSQPARGHRVTKLLARPNSEMNRANLLGLASTHLNAQGNSYWGKKFSGVVDADGNDIVSELWPIPADCVRVIREDGEKHFYVRDADTGREYPDPSTSGEIIHFMGFSLDGLVGLSPIGFARETIGAGLAADHFEHVFWRNSGVPPLVLTSEQELTDAARKRMRRDWDRVQRGFRNAWRTAILEAGVKPMPLSLPKIDEQFLATGNHTVQAVCRWFGVWPSMIGAASADTMTYKNLEGEALRFLMFSMSPEWALIEQTLEGDQDLFPMRLGDVEPQFFPKFKRDDFLQVDPLTQAKLDALSTAGRLWELPSEIRKRRNLPPDPRVDDATFNPPGKDPSVGAAG